MLLLPADILPLRAGEVYSLLRVGLHTGVGCGSSLCSSNGRHHSGVGRISADIPGLGSGEQTMRVWTRKSLSEVKSQKIEEKLHFCHVRKFRFTAF